MELTPELLGSFAVGLIVIIGAVGNYLTQRRAQKATPTISSPVLTGIGMELGNKEEMRELIAQVRRLGDIIADKKQDEMEDRLDKLVDVIERMHMPPR